jgi:hypothetical protein
MMTVDQVKALLAKPTISPDELFQAGILPLSRNGIYSAIQRGEIEAIEQRLTVLRREAQPDPTTGKHREVPVLPRSLILGKEQRMLVERHISALDQIMDMTPESGADFGEATTIAVSKMTMVLAGREAGELASEAKGEAFIDALEDVPSWAVQEAMRRWHRGECGPKHDYKWQPAPATLRELAMIEVYRVKAVRRRLADLVLAEPLLEFTNEQLESMKARTAQHLTMRTA